MAAPERWQVNSRAIFLRNSSSLHREASRRIVLPGIPGRQVEASKLETKASNGNSNSNANNNSNISQIGLHL